MRSEGACHGNYPRACHTKRSLIRRRKSGLFFSPFFPIQRSFQIERERESYTECSPAVCSYFNEGVFPANPFVPFLGTSFAPTLHVYRLHFTWCIVVLFLPSSTDGHCVGESPSGAAFLLKSGLECGRPCKITFQ